MNDLDRALNTCLLNTADIDGSVIININLNTGLIDDRIDGLTLLTNDLTDLLRVNLHLLDLRCIFANLRTWSCDCRLHTGIHDE